MSASGDVSAESRDLLVPEAGNFVVVDHANRLHTELQGQLTSEQLEAVQVRAKAKSLAAVVNKILE